jgi:hypothetical protein
MTTEEEDELPQYEDVEDEGIGMEEGLPRPLFGPTLPPRDIQMQIPTISGVDAVQWSWARDFVPVGGGLSHDQRGLYADDVDADADIDDAASNEAAGGNFSDGESGQERLLQDFGDEFAAGPATLEFGASPGATAMEEEFMDDEGIGVGQHHILGGDEDAEDVPVEVRVDESSEGGHMKMD